MRILVTGSNGQVGSALCAMGLPQDDLIPANRSLCDLTSEQSIRAAVRQVAPQVIVNAAAYTAVDLAETERDLCYQVNAIAPGILAEEAARLGAVFIHYSTDYVFNGAKPTPYVESDAIDPLNAYGASKAAGEQAVLNAGGRSLILRTSWVYSTHGKNFLLTMLRLGRERSELRVVDDQIGAPTSATAIAGATLRLIEQTVSLNDTSFPTGIYHMTAAGQTSWCGFARAIFDAAGLQPRVFPIPTTEFPTPARRPANSTLSNQKFARTFGFMLDSWEAQLQAVLAHIQSAASPSPSLTSPAR